MTHTNIGAKIAYKEETHYGGGIGASKYISTPIIAATAGVALFSFQAAEAKLLGKKIKKERFRGTTTNGTSRLTVITDVESPEIVIEQYIQDDYWWKFANQPTAAETTIKTEACSWLIHIELPNPATGTYEAYDLVGCKLKKYEFKAKPGSAPTEKLTFICYDQVASVISTLAAVTGGYDILTLPSVWRDVALTVDSDVIGELTEVNYTLTNSFTNEKSNKATSFRSLDRIFLVKEIELMYKAQTDTAAIAKDILTETAAFSSYTAVLDAGYAVVATITNLDVDDSDWATLNNEPKEFEYSITLKQGDSEISVA